MIEKAYGRKFIISKWVPRPIRKRIVFEYYYYVDRIMLKWLNYFLKDMFDCELERRLGYKSVKFAKKHVKMYVKRFNKELPISQSKWIKYKFDEKAGELLVVCKFCEEITIKEVSQFKKHKKF